MLSPRYNSSVRSEEFEVVLLNYSIPLGIRSTVEAQSGDVESVNPNIVAPLMAQRRIVTYLSNARIQYIVTANVQLIIRRGRASVAVNDHRQRSGPALHCSIISVVNYWLRRVPRALPRAEVLSPSERRIQHSHRCSY